MLFIDEIKSKNTLIIKKGEAKNLEKARMKRTEIKMGGQGWYSVSADENKILIITIQAAKHQQLALLMFLRPEL